MKRWLQIAWIAGLTIAAVASWLVWSLSGIENIDLRFGAALAPLLFWAVLTVIAWQLSLRSGLPSEARLLREQRRAVLDYLAGHGMKGRRLYSLPFVCVIGPQGSGKTSVIEQLEKDAGEGLTVGDTIWRVGRSAVFIEISTGVTDMESSSAFELLRSIRAKLPLNASLLVVSPADLTLADQTEQRAVAKAIGNDLRALDDLTGLTAPVYLLLAKTDLVPGFNEFFDRYEAQERSQPWGFALSYPGDGQLHLPQGVQDEIDRGFLDLVAAMRLRHIEWLSRELDPIRCAHLQGFAAHIAALRKAIDPTLDALLSDPGHNKRGRLLRGIFLTSARQETLSIDALLPELSRRFAMPRIGMLPPDLTFDENERSYFISGTLEKAVLPEAGLALRGQKRGRFQLINWAVIATNLIVAAAIGYQLFNTFERQVWAAARVSETVAFLRPIDNPSRPEDLIDVLAKLKRLAALKSDIAAVPEPSNLIAPSSNSRTLVSAIDDAEKTLRRNALLPHLQALVEALLVNDGLDAAVLRQQLTLAHDLAQGTPATVRGVLEQQALRVAPDNADLFVSQAMAAIGEAGGLSVSQAYLDAAQRLIAYKESLS